MVSSVAHHSHDMKFIAKPLEWYWRLRLAIAIKRRGVKGFHASLRPNAVLWRAYRDLYYLLTSKDNVDYDKLRSEAVSLDEEDF